MPARIQSFGFKRSGPPVQTDIVIFDVRRITDPAKDLQLRTQTGLDEAVQRGVLAHPLAGIFLESAVRCLRAGLSVAFGCAQGRHRSVALAQVLAERTGQSVQHLDWSALPHEEAGSGP